MITKEECLPGTRVIVNDKVSKTNKDLGATNNGIILHLFHVEGLHYDTPVEEAEPGRVLTILSKPKKIGESGVQVKVDIGDGNVYAAFWSAFKFKVNLRD